VDQTLHMNYSLKALAGSAVPWKKPYQQQLLSCPDGKHK
jgi:hypothetical protein